jgi:uncharacterized repeat protein (TIGR01451 family)
MQLKVYTPPSFGRRNRSVFCSLLILGAIFGVLFAKPFERRLTSSAHAGDGKIAGSHRSQSAFPDVALANRAYGNIPLSFAVNEGQAPSDVTFMARGNGYGVFLTQAGAVLSLAHSREVSTTDAVQAVQRASAKHARTAVAMKLLAARPDAYIRGKDELPGKLNYFIGNDPGKWRTNMDTYARVHYASVYRGIDVLYYGNQRELEYDFVIAPRANPRQIKLHFSGASLSIDKETGDLILRTPAGDLRQRKPVAYQEIQNQRREVAAAYRIKGNTVTFEIGDYDKSRELVIDPVLIYSSFLGGFGTEQGLGIAVDAQGNAYVTGSTGSSDFPLAAALQNTKDAFNDAFVVKLNPAGTALVYSTFVGANGDDVGNAIAVDGTGSAYVAGLTGSGSFPTTAGAFQTSKSGAIDGFAIKLNPTGSQLVYSTFLGGENNEQAFGVAVDASGRAYVVGRSDSQRLGFAPLQRHGSPAYKTTNSAAQWSASDTDLTPSNVTSFAVDPNNSNIIYAGSNYGVFKSLNGGTQWIPTGTSQAALGAALTNALAIDPSNSSIVYAGTSSGVFKSTNAGAVYTLKNTGFLSPFVNALAIDPLTPTTIYAGTSLGVYKSNNGGDTWTEVKNGISGSSPRVLRVVIDPTNSAVVYIATNRGIFKTTNGGSLWTVMNNGLTLTGSLQINGLAIDPVNPATLYASGQGTAGLVLKTVDGGLNWNVTDSGLPGNVGNLTVDPVTPTTVYAGTTAAGIYKSTNGGTNWAGANTGLANLLINAIVIDRNNPSTIYAGSSIGNDAFIVRLGATGTLDYLASLGGNETDEARGVAVDANNNAYIVGSTNSPNFPMANAFQPALSGISDAFLTQINSSGSSLNYSTFLGGSGPEQGRAVAVRGANAYITGQTTSQNFPLVNAFKATLPDFDTDAFVTKFNTSGMALDYSTFLGGSSIDQGFGIAVDANGNAYITGGTSSSDFPTLDATQPSPVLPPDAFVTKVNAAGNALSYSTFLSGIAGDVGNGIAVDSVGNAYIIGTTSSSDFPTAHPFQSTLKGTDAFVTKIGVEAELSITKADSRDPVMVNNPLSYILTVTNAGPSAATGVRVTDVLPAGLTLGSANSTSGSCSLAGSTVACDVGTLVVAGSATITIAVTPTAPGTISNTASVIANEPDSNAVNNSATETTKVSASPSIRGFVKDPNGNAAAGVLMSLTGTQNTSVQTDANGFYQFAELPAGGNYVLIPTKLAFSIEPQSQTFNNLNADQTANFVAYACTYVNAPAVHSFGAAGGSATVTVTSLHDCPWTAVSHSDWITITSGTAGVGSGAVNFTVSATTVPRAGHMTIAGQNVPVYQEVDSCGAPAFSVANYSVGLSPARIRALDLNGDGHPDAIVAPGVGSTAAVMLNNGAGGFSVGNWNIGAEPAGFDVADFNGDSRPDIAVTSYNFSSVLITLNNGSGGFIAPQSIPFTTGGQSPLTRAVFAADVNNDGRVDLLVNTPGTGGLQVLLGNGSGAFAQQAQVIGNAFDVPIAVADVTADGNIDLIYAGGGNDLRTVSIKAGNGAGGFGSAIVSANTGVTGNVAFADFDSDGNLDIAGSSVIKAADWTPANQKFVNAISILTGDGAGHFVTRSSFESSGGPNLTVADFNNDGKADVGFVTGGSKATVVLGNGIGGFGNSIVVDTGASDSTGGNFGIAAADFNGDHKQDLAVADYSRGASVLRNNCAGAPAISGRVTDSRTTGGLAGVTMTLSGAQSATTQSDAGGNFFFGDLTTGANYVVTPTKDNFKFVPANASVNNLTGIQTTSFVGTPVTLQFTSQDYVVDEFAGSIKINIKRNGDLSGVTTVDYTTLNDTASARTDYTEAIGTIRFAPGESQKGFLVLITDDLRVEGWESVRLRLSNPVGAVFNSIMEGAPPTSLLEIRDNDFNAPTTNPLDNPTFFVRQHYYDFLSRVPDDEGLAYWSGQITQCGSDQACVRNKRIDVSNAFFYELEYQQTAAFVYRLYRAAYGNNQPFPNLDPDPNHLGEEKKLVAYKAFAPDRARVVGGVNLAQAQLDMANVFVLRPEFLAKYPGSLDGPAFVDAILATIKNDIGPDLTSQRQALIDLYNSGGRGTVLYRLADDNTQTNPINNRAFIDAEYSRSFVATQYYGYLRRDPDMGGFLFWLGQVNSGPLRDPAKQHAMVCSFITSTEYQERFSNIVTHSNAECGP